MQSPSVRASALRLLLIVAPLLLQVVRMPLPMANTTPIVAVGDLVAIGLAGGWRLGNADGSAVMMQPLVVGSLPQRVPSILLGASMAALLVRLSQLPARVASTSANQISDHQGAGWLAGWLVGWLWEKSWGQPTTRGKAPCPESTARLRLVNQKSSPPRDSKVQDSNVRHASSLYHNNKTTPTPTSPSPPPQGSPDTHSYVKADPVQAGAAPQHLM